MLIGIGNDIIEIDRVRRSIDRYGDKFLNRLFSKREQEYCLRFKDSASRFAVRFAAKEAVVKALGTGFSGDIDWLDIEIMHTEVGKPYVHLSPKLNERFENPYFLISLSHSRDYASAVAIWSEK